MRAATAIVGAIAVSSILIALAFLLSSGGGSGGAQVTRTITVEAAAPEAGEPAGEETGSTQLGGPAQCDGGEFTVEGTSCEVGAKIHDQYAQGNRGQLIAVGAQETITMTCAGAAPVTCSGPGGAKVYFAP